MKTLRHTYKKGFTIIESLVAITVLVLAVTGSMTAVQTGISSYIYSKNQIIAFYLAQEAVEQIKNIRDENRLAGAHWLNGLAVSSSDPCYFGHACTVSPVESTIPTRCNAPGSCPVLRQNSSTKFYGYNGSWSSTVFRREIQLTSIAENEVAITVTVNWSKGIITRQFKAQENILNW